MKLFLYWILFLIAIFASSIGFITALFNPEKKYLFSKGFGLLDERLKEEVWDRIFSEEMISRPLHLLKNITTEWVKLKESQRPAKFFSFIIVTQFLTILFLIWKG